MKGPRSAQSGRWGSWFSTPKCCVAMMSVAEKSPPRLPRAGAVHHAKGGAAHPQRLFPDAGERIVFQDVRTGPDGEVAVRGRPHENRSASPDSGSPPRPRHRAGLGLALDRAEAFRPADDLAQHVQLGILRCVADERLGVVAAKGADAKVAFGPVVVVPVQNGGRGATGKGQRLHRQRPHDGHLTVRGQGFFA